MTTHTDLTNAINSHAAALQALSDLRAELARMRVAGEAIEASFIDQVDAAFLAEVEAERVRDAVIAEAKAAGVMEAQNMYIAPTRGADVLAMEYKSIKRAGGKLTF